tara:strand:- start:109446 stop:110498 length:1053 start_codon:yes stop_codon:yes gene_type:complete
MIRPAYSLIELVAALIASTVLIIGLASTISISTQLLESPLDDAAEWHEHEIADRLAGDLRYARTVQNNWGSGFQITRPDPTSGNDEPVAYQADSAGLTRQVSGIPTAVLDPETPNIHFSVDGYTAPTALPLDETVRVRSHTTAASGSQVSSLTINTPPGCKPNDLLLLCISGKTPNYVAVSNGGWQTVQSTSISNLRLTVLYRSYDASYPTSTTLTPTNSSALSAVLLAIEGADQYSPINWSGIDSGYTVPIIPTTGPDLVESAVITEKQLNVQIYSAEGHPWLDNTIGLASFVDIGQAESASGSYSSHNSIAVSVRNGHSPSLSFTPRPYFSSFAYWLNVGVHLKARQW